MIMFAKLKSIHCVYSDKTQSRVVHVLYIVHLDFGMEVSGRELLAVARISTCTQRMEMSIQRERRWVFLACHVVSEPRWRKLYVFDLQD